MNQYRFHDAEELAEMKEKLNIYKGMLRSIKSGNVLEDYLLSKTESYEFKIILKGVMKKMEDYQYGSAESSEQLSAQIQSVNETVSVLKNDIALIKEKMDRLQVHDLIGKMNQIIDTHQSPVKNKEEKEVDLLKEELAQLKKQMSNTQQQATVQEADVQQSEKTSDFRKLQNMLQSSKQVNHGKNDYYPAMDQGRSYNHHHPTFQQKNKSYTQPPISKLSQAKGSTSKNRTYINPQMDMYQNNIYRTDSKKNDEESAQERVKAVRNTNDKKEINVQFKKQKELEKQNHEWENKDQEIRSEKKNFESTELVKENNELGPEKLDSEDVTQSNKVETIDATAASQTNSQNKENQDILKEENINSNRHLSEPKPTAAREEEDKEAIEKPSKKIEFSSFFSIFQKKN